MQQHHSFFTAGLSLGIGAMSIGLFDLLVKNVAVSVWSYNPWYFVAPQGNPYTPIGLIYTANPGIAWGIPVPVGISLFLTAIIVGIALSYFYDHPELFAEQWVLWSMILLSGGMVSNTWDRLTKGFVVDYIQFGAFPVFNLGDAAITVGTFLLLIHAVRPHFSKK